MIFKRGLHLRAKSRALQLFSPILLAVVLTGCGGAGGKTIYSEKTKFGYQSFYVRRTDDKGNYVGALTGLDRNGTRILDPIYAFLTFPVTSVNKEEPGYAFGYRDESKKVWEVISLPSGKARATTFTKMTTKSVVHPSGMTQTLMVGMRELPDKRAEFTILDDAGNERSTFFGKEGSTTFRKQGDAIVLDSIDEEGKPFGSIHDKTGLPISPKMMPFFHTNLSVGDRPDQGYFRASRSKEMESFWGYVGNQANVVVGRLPQQSIAGGRIVRPVLDDGSLLAPPKGAIGFLPLVFQPDDPDRIHVHRLWAVVFVGDSGLRYAVGAGLPKFVAERAANNELPIYEDIRVAKYADASTQFAVRPLGTKTFEILHAYDGSILFRDPSRTFATPEETLAAWNVSQEAEKKRAEAEAVKKRVEAAKKLVADLQRENARLRAVVEASISSDGKYYEGLMAIRSVGDKDLWTRFIEKYKNRDNALSNDDLRWAEQKGVEPTLLAAARSHILDYQRRMSEYDAAVAARLARLHRENSERMAEEARWFITDWPSSIGGNSSAGMTYLNKIGYESMVKQNTQAWSGGSNAWGRSWGPK